MKIVMFACLRRGLAIIKNTGKVNAQSRKGNSTTEGGEVGAQSKKGKDTREGGAADVTGILPCPCHMGT